MKAPPNPASAPGPKRKRSLSIRILLLGIALAAATPFAFFGWKDLYTNFLEHNAPIITVVDFPRGIGLTPVSMKIHVEDADSGLDEVVVRARQREDARDILRQSLNGENRADVTIDFPGEQSEFEEGEVEIEIRSFDRSLWSNTAEELYRLKVDFRRPHVELLTTQHNVRRGGSQLAIYKVVDEDVAISGVKVGSQAFLGFPARGLDQEIKDSSVYVAIYAIDLDQPEPNPSIRLFAEDQVGNAASLPFFNRIMPQQQRERRFVLSDEFLRGPVSELADHNFDRLQELASESGADLTYVKPKGSAERLIEKFQLVVGPLREQNELELQALLKGARYERYFEEGFVQEPGTVAGVFGDRVSFVYGNTEVAKFVRKGYQLTPPRDDREVVAVSDGIVSFSDNIGVYGRVVGIDHGLGLVSIYGYLESSSVVPGDSVTAGDKIGIAGTTGLSHTDQIYFEMRVHGVPVDPREWWDRSWYYAHIVAKLNDVKRQLGIAVYRPFG